MQLGSGEGMYKGWLNHIMQSRNACIKRHDTHFNTFLTSGIEPSQDTLWFQLPPIRVQQCRPYCIKTLEGNPSHQGISLQGICAPSDLSLLQGKCHRSNRCPGLSWHTCLFHIHMSTQFLQYNTWLLMTMPTKCCQYCMYDYIWLVNWLHGHYISKYSPRKPLS